MTICLMTAPTATEYGNLEDIRAQPVQQIASEPALGILTLAAVLRQRGESPGYVDLNRAYFDYAESDAFPGADFAEIVAHRIAACGTDIYGFGSLCSSYPTTIRIAKALKLLRPKATILIGGPQASVVDTQTLAAFPFVDLILRGECERSLPLLLDELAGERRLDRVPGLTYRAGSQVQRNPLPPVIEDLDALPTPAYDLSGELRGAARASLELGRGCPFSCTFCSTNDFFRRRFRLRSPLRVLRDMRALAAEYSLSHFVLTHDMFTVDRRRVVEFCEVMIASGEKFTWGCSARTDCIDEDLLTVMQKAGCRNVFLGIEVGSERMQKIIDKGLNLRRARELVDFAERIGVGTIVSMITGFPEETWEDVRQSVIFFMHSLKCAQSTPQLNVLAPLAETPLYTRYKDQLTLEELCSDMSSQSRTLNQLDVALIREHTEIFPNFYLIPTPHLDRSAHLEMVEFFSVGVVRFRWLLSAIDQATSNMLDFFFEWREFRLQVRPGLVGTQLRNYYRIREFHGDFVSFVAVHEVSGNEAVNAFLELETAMLRRAMQPNVPRPAGEVLLAGSELWSTDVPLVMPQARVVELNCNIQLVVEGVKRRSEPIWLRGPHFYVTRRTTSGVNQLCSISHWVAAVLCACDGRRTIATILRCLRTQIPEVNNEVRDYVYLRLLREIQALGYIEIYRDSDAKSFAKNQSAKNQGVRRRRVQKDPDNQLGLRSASAER